MKYVGLILILLLLFALVFPRKAPALLRRAGKSAGDLRRMGEELATNREIERSPLARFEVRAGEIVEMRLLAEHPFAQDHALQAKIHAVGSRLAEHAIRKQIPYRFAVLEANDPNAFAVPGGAVFITRPLVELCGGDPDLLACVLGHEIVHIDQRHAIRKLGASSIATKAFQILTLGRGALLARLAGGVEKLFVQGYSQDQEIEADIWGARLARLAGYDPRGAITLFERLKAPSTDGKGPIAETCQYFKSHPPISMRIARLKAEVG